MTTPERAQSNGIRRRGGRDMSVGAEPTGACLQGLGGWSLKFDEYCNGTAIGTVLGYGRARLLAIRFRRIHVGVEGCLARGQAKQDRQDRAVGLAMEAN